MLLAAAALTAIVAGLVFAAVALRGPGSTVDTPRGPAASSTPVTTLPDGTRTARTTGEFDGVPYVLQTRRFPTGQVTVEAHSGALELARFENPPSDRVLAMIGSGGPEPIVVGTTPPSANSGACHAR